MVSRGVGWGAGGDLPVCLWHRLPPLVCPLFNAACVWQISGHRPSGGEVVRGGLGMRLRADLIMFMCVSVLFVPHVEMQWQGWWRGARPWSFIDMC